MTMRPEIKPALWGAVGGAVLLAIVGFSWGGWVTGASADQRAKKNADSAVVAILAPICVQQFRAQPDAATRLDELTKMSTSSERAMFVEKSGWATMPGSDTPIIGVAASCVAILMAPA
jgi:alpha/beta superfamily hydrolase